MFSCSLGIVKFRARSQKIRDALLWLKSNNIYSHHIEIDEDVLQALPDDGDIAHMLNNLSNEPTETDENIEHNELLVESSIPHIENIDQQEVIARN